MASEPRRFLDLYVRWAEDLKAPKRWRTPTPEALAWFLTEIMARPDVIEGINVLATLNRWGDWLAVKAEAAGKPGAASGAKFPENWKNSLRNWFQNAKTYAAAPATRRGAYRGAPPLSIPDPTPTRPATGDKNDDFDTWE